MPGSSRRTRRRRAGAIAIRYLGEAEGAAKAEAYGDDVLIRIEPGFVRAWDFADEYGGCACEG